MVAEPWLVRPGYTASPVLLSVIKRRIKRMIRAHLWSRYYRAPAQAKGGHYYAAAAANGFSMQKLRDSALICVF